MADDKETLELKIRIAAEEAFAAVSSLKGEVAAMAGEFKRFAEADGKALDAAIKQTKEAADQAAASFKLFGGSGNELRNVQAQLKTAATELVKQGLDPQSEEVKQLVEEYKRLGKEAAELDKATGENIDSFGQLQSAITSLAEVAAFAKMLGYVKDLGAFALKTADDFQTMRNQFGVLLGDMEKGAGLFNQIKAFGDRTPFDLSTLTQATNVLIAAKVPLKDMEDQLTKFGDLSQGNAQRMTSYVNAFSQAAAKGKADMQILNTYLNQGVPILDALAKNFGVTTAEVVEMSSQGQISFEDFSRALDDLTAAGGRYFGGMELASKSLASMQEGLSEAVNTLAASFGEMLMPAAIGVIEILTQITSAVDESPIAKGLLAAALAAVTVQMAAMAVAATKAFAAKMGLNFAMGVTNPAILAATIAAAGMAAAYIKVASDAQKAKRELENFALTAKKSADEYAKAFSTMSDVEIGVSLRDAERAVTSLERLLGSAQNKLEGLRNAAYESEAEIRRARRAEINSLEADIASYEQRLEAAREAFENQKAASRSLGETAGTPAPVFTGGNNAAANWFKQWEEQYKRFRGELEGNPFTGMEIELELKLKEAGQYKAGTEIINQINEYYEEERKKIIKGINDEEERLANSLTKTRMDDLATQHKQQMEAIDALEKMRVFAAGESEEAIAQIREQYAAMRLDAAEQYEADLAKTRFEEARDAVKDWQQALSESLSAGLMNIKGFSGEAAITLGELSAQLIALGANFAMDGITEFGKALSSGGDAAENLRGALGAMAQQILQQLPMMFLQAGLQLIASGQWPLGLGFIAAAGSTAFISGYASGEAEKAQKEAEETQKAVKAHAQGGVFDGHGAARAFAEGGAFTNQIVNRPTYFKYGGGLGVMGEAGPEAVMPLARMPDGKLGVQTAGGGTRVTVNIINNTNAEVHTEETEDADGNVQWDIAIGRMVDGHIASGKADRVLGARFGLRAQGV